MCECLCFDRHKQYRKQQNEKKTHTQIEINKHLENQFGSISQKKAKQVFSIVPQFECDF